MLISLQLYKEAIIDLDLFLKKQPSHARAYCLRAEAWKHVGDHHKSRLNQRVADIIDGNWRARHRKPGGILIAASLTGWIVAYLIKGTLGHFEMYWCCQVLAICLGLYGILLLLSGFPENCWFCHGLESYSNDRGCSYPALGLLELALPQKPSLSKALAILEKANCQ